MEQKGAVEETEKEAKNQFLYDDPLLHTTEELVEEYKEIFEAIMEVTTTGYNDRTVLSKMGHRRHDVFGVRYIASTGYDLTSYANKPRVTYYYIILGLILDARITKLYRPDLLITTHAGWIRRTLALFLDRATLPSFKHGYEWKDGINPDLHRLDFSWFDKSEASARAQSNQRALDAAGDREKIQKWISQTEKMFRVFAPKAENVPADLVNAVSARSVPLLKQMVHVSSVFKPLCLASY